MELPGTVLFLCPHNAAKSVIAAAYFDIMAIERGLPFRADSAGTEPDDHPWPAVIAALQADDIDVAGYRPHHVTAEDLAHAHRVISLGCTLDDLAPSTVQVDHWDDVPPPSRGLEASRAAIMRRMDTLVAELADRGQ